MDQRELLDVAKARQGLTSDNKLALRLGITRARVSLLRSGERPADEAEIFMLADMAGIDPHLAAAAVRKDRERDPKKRAYWEKIALRFSMAAVLITICFIAEIPHANAANLTATTYKLCEIKGASRGASSLPNSLFPILPGWVFIRLKRMKPFDWQVRQWSALCRACTTACCN